MRPSFCWITATYFGAHILSGHGVDLIFNSAADCNWKRADIFKIRALLPRVEKIRQLWRTECAQCSHTAAHCACARAFVSIKREATLVTWSHTFGAANLRVLLIEGYVLRPEWKGLSNSTTGDRGSCRTLAGLVQYIVLLQVSSSLRLPKWFAVNKVIAIITRKPSCRWQTRATLAKSLRGLRKSSGVVSCIARLPIDSLPMVSYYVLYSNYL